MLMIFNYFCSKISKICYCFFLLTAKNEVLKLNVITYRCLVFKMVYKLFSILNISFIILKKLTFLSKAVELKMTLFL